MTYDLQLRKTATLESKSLRLHLTMWHFAQLNVQAKKHRVKVKSTTLKLRLSIKKFEVT